MYVYSLNLTITNKQGNPAKALSEIQNLVTNYLLNEGVWQEKIDELIVFHLVDNKPLIEINSFDIFDSFRFCDFEDFLKNMLKKLECEYNLIYEHNNEDEKETSIIGRMIDGEVQTREFDNKTATFSVNKKLIIDLLDEDGITIEEVKKRLNSEWREKYDREFGFAK